VALVVSGGHTTLLEVRSYLELRFLGGTTDDAAGEAFDKVAQLLDLGYPGGPAVARAAQDGDPAAVSLPRSLLGPESLDFSFSGLKTAVLYLVRGQQGRPPKRIFPLSDVAASFQEAVVDTLVAKCARALDATGHRSILVGGGVAANVRLREKLHALAAERGVRLAMAKPEFCTDNAAMVAACGWFRYAAGAASEDDGFNESPLAADADPNSSLLSAP
jgi:N6-L-threonylcarbamoyladenine synthase